MPTPDLFEGVSPEVQQAIRAFCGWHVAPSITETVTLDGPGSDVLHLPSLHVTDVAALSVEGTSYPNPEWSAAGLVRNSALRTRRFRAVSVTYTHGFDELPMAVRAAADRLATTATLQAAANVRIGGISVTAPSLVTRSAADTTGDAYVDNILSEYRIGLRA